MTTTWTAIEERVEWTATEDPSYKFETLRPRTVSVDGGSGSGPDLSDANPQDLGTAGPGTSPDASRADHVHDMPSAADVGAAATSHTHAAADLVSGTVATARLGSGTADSTTFLRGDQTWATPASGAASVAPFYGSGVDGDVTISGTTSLTRDMYYNNLAVTGTLWTANYKVFVAGTLSGNGTIGTPGTDSTNQTAAATFASGTLGGGQFGGNGTTTVGAASPALTNRVGGHGGAGGAGSSGAGGAAPSGTDPTALNGGFLVAHNLAAFERGTLTSGAQFRAATGGSGGGGDSANSGGAGGAGGGQVLIAARLCTFTGTITVKGGNGATRSAGNVGGGGGGGGGVLHVVTGSATQTFTTNVAGGTGGSGVGTGTAGSNGSVGTAIVHLGAS